MGRWRGTWKTREELFLDEAGRDLEAGADPRACLLACRGDELVLIASLRRFSKGDHAQALLEVLALAMPLRLDRLALSISARAWSLEDPIPPVLGDGEDLRQRVLVVVEAEAGGGGARSWLRPFDHVEGLTTWGDRLDEPRPAGELASMIGLAVEHADRLSASDDDLRAQAQRCLDLGHFLLAGPPLLDVLQRAAPDRPPQRRSRQERGGPVSTGARTRFPHSVHDPS